MQILKSFGWLLTSRHLSDTSDSVIGNEQSPVVFSLKSVKCGILEHLEENHL